MNEPSCVSSSGVSSCLTSESFLTKILPVLLIVGFILILDSITSWIKELMFLDFSLIPFSLHAGSLLDQIVTDSGYGAEMDLTI